MAECGAPKVLEDVLKAPIESAVRNIDGVITWIAVFINDLQANTRDFSSSIAGVIEESIAQTRMDSVYEEIRLNPKMLAPFPIVRII